jgi:carbonic anhydrase
MQIAPMPAFLVDRHRHWRAAITAADRERLSVAAMSVQRPKAMIIACCDSRVMASDVFGAEAGEFFVHRNLASLVPPFQPDGRQHGTSATLEYAVGELRIAHLIVMGHHGCGGVRSCHAMLTGGAPELNEPASFVGAWLRVLEPGFEEVQARGLSGEEGIVALEKQAVLTSLRNLTTFPFLSRAIDEGRLQIHGAWKDIRDGSLEVYDPAQEAFLRL